MGFANRGGINILKGGKQLNGKVLRIICITFNKCAILIPVLYFHWQIVTNFGASWQRLALPRVVLGVLTLNDGQQI